MAANQSREAADQALQVTISDAWRLNLNSC